MPVLNRVYEKRLKPYKAVGYTVARPSAAEDARAHLRSLKLNTSRFERRSFLRKREVAESKASKAMLAASILFRVVSAPVIRASRSKQGSLK